jgi:hypothetical protein
MVVLANSSLSIFPGTEQIDQVHAEIAKTQKHWAKLVESWEALTAVGLDKIHHPSKLFLAATESNESHALCHHAWTKNRNTMLRTCPWQTPSHNAQQSGKLRRASHEH